MARIACGALALLLGAAGCLPRARTPAAPPVQEREIRGGEVHAYPVDLQAGQFLRVLVEEEGFDLTLRLLDAKGKLVAGAASPLTDRAFATEDLAALAKEAGPHSLEVIAAGEGSGRYRLRLEEPRAPSAADRTRADAVQALWNGDSSAGLPVQDQIESLERALDLFRQAGDAEKAAETQFGIGVKHYEELSAYDEALEDFRQAAASWERLPGRRCSLFRAEAVTWEGRCLRHSGRPGDARSAHEEALALARDLGEPGLQMENLNLLGRIDADAGEARSAVNLHAQALELARQAGDRTQESLILNNLGIARELLGEVQKALELYLEALELTPEPIRRRATFLNNVGDTYRALGEWPRALDYYRRAAELSAALGTPEEGTILTNLAVAYRQQGEGEQARQSLQRALALGRQKSLRNIQVFALAHLALQASEKEPARAAELAREALRLAGSLGEEAFAHLALGSALRDLGQPADARAELGRALELMQRRGIRGQQAELHLLLARMDRDANDLGSALSQVRSAIDLIESGRGGIIDPELKASFLASRQDYYELQMDTLMALHAKRPAARFAAEALQASEHTHARALLDILNEANADIQQGADPALIRKEQEAREDVNSRDRHRRDLLAAEPPDRASLAAAEKKLDEALEHQQRIQVELRRSSPRYAELTQPQTLGVEEIQRQLLDGEALLLEYSLGARRSFLWAVAPDALAGFELPGRAEIEAAARRYYELLTVRNDRRQGEPLPEWKKRIEAADSQLASAGRDLSRLILAPAEPLLGDRPLLVVADGALQYIPFAALPLPATGAPLVSRHEIVSLPSASVLAALRRETRNRPRAAKALAIFADPVFQRDDERFSPGAVPPDRTAQQPPPLRGTEADDSREQGLDLSALRRLSFSRKEADAIAALVPPGEAWEAVGFDASRDAVAGGGLEAYRDVHFATHGVLDSEHPGMSGLVLSLYDANGESRDGVLRLNDIYNLRLNADLVVLSACRTALGKEVKGEGLIGLTRGFMYAGAARVLASLWSVEDRATTELMAGFYRGMLHDGLSPAAALRRAQLAMAGARPPYFWAGFSLQGDWR